MKIFRANLALLAINITASFLGAAAITPQEGVPTAADILSYGNMWGSFACVSDTFDSSLSTLRKGL